MGLCNTCELVMMEAVDEVLYLQSAPGLDDNAIGQYLPVWYDDLQTPHGEVDITADMAVITSLPSVLESLLVGSRTTIAVCGFLPPTTRYTDLA